MDIKQGSDNSAIRLLFPDYRIEYMQLMQFQEKDSDKPQLCLYDSENDFILKESEYMEITIE